MTSEPQGDAERLSLEWFIQADEDEVSTELFDRSRHLNNRRFVEDRDRAVALLDARGSLLRELAARRLAMQTMEWVYIDREQAGAEICPACGVEDPNKHDVQCVYTAYPCTSTTLNPTPKGKDQ